MAKKPAFDWDDKKAVERLRKQATYLSAQELARANAAALNRAGKAASGVVRRRIGKKTTAPQSKYAESVKKDKQASAARGQYQITVDGNKNVKLQHFRDMKQTPSGVQVKIFRSGKKSILRGTFIVQSLSGDAFTRRGKARGPLKTLYGPSPTQVVVDVETAMVERFNKVFATRIVQEIRFRVSRGNR
jgi:hypothetical protein